MVYGITTNSAICTAEEAIETEKRLKCIKNELVRVLTAHKLTVEVATTLLRDCASDLTADALQASVKGIYKD